jgi:hypothetical protein
MFPNGDSVEKKYHSSQTPPTHFPRSNSDVFLRRFHFFRQTALMR